MSDNQLNSTPNQPGEDTPRKETEATEISSADGAESFTAGNMTPEIATNDGTVIETLDTALHGTPGWAEGENPSGSSRADYYEARSNGKSDSEEEMDEIRRGRA